MERQYLERYKKNNWAICPICAFLDCRIYEKGKNKGLFRCFECNIRFKKTEILNGVR